ncbi:unnamed protein product, partial [marine sediment metagenome]
TEAFERFTGISAYKREVSYLTDELDSLEDSMKAVALAQSELNIGSAALSTAQSRLRMEFELGRMSEEQYKRDMEGLSRASSVAGFEASKLALATAVLGNETNQAKATQDAYTESIDNAWKKWTGMQTMEDAQKGLRDFFRSRGEPMTPMSGTYPSMPGGGGGITIQIDMTGSEIYGEEGILEAFRAGARELGNVLQFTRVPTR